MKVLASVISFEFPERHVRDFLYSSKIFYDSEGSVTIPGDELSTHQNKTPWKVSLSFDKKKLTSREPWS